MTNGFLVLSTALFVGWPNTVHIIAVAEWSINLDTGTP